MPVERKRQLFEDILRLRRAERATPTPRDLVSVRARLEDELGATVSQRLAAELLGVSHTALRRWVESGDVPLVYNARGRWEVPVPAVLQLREAIDAQRARGDRSRHLLEPTMQAARARAEALDPSALLPPDAHHGDARSRARRRSLAYHRAVADRLSPALVRDALHTIWAWRERGKIDKRWAARWEDALRRPPREIAEIIGEDSGAADDLRQNSPFAGMLSEVERRKILETVR